VFDKVGTTVAQPVTLQLPLPGLRVFLRRVGVVGQVAATEMAAMVVEIAVVATIVATTEFLVVFVDAFR
jgi:hypothetical protein